MQAFDTGRLHMRHLVETDEAVYCDLYCNPETMRHIGLPLSPQDAKRSFRKALAGSKRPLDRQLLAMVDKDTLRVIGLCGIDAFDAGTRQAELGMMLKAAARAQGYATEALAALVTAAFSSFPIDSVWVQYSLEHTAAERLVVAVGFTRCANAVIGNRSSATCVWSIDRSLWGQRHNQ